MGSPVGGGFSAEGRERLDRFFAREIEASRVRGAVVAIARDGKLIHHKSYGYIGALVLLRGIEPPTY